MTTTPDTEIRVINGALDESDIRGGSIILRGVIHPENLQFLQVDAPRRRLNETEADTDEAA